MVECFYRLTVVNDKGIPIKRLLDTWLNARDVYRASCDLPTTIFVTLYSLDQIGPPELLAMFVKKGTEPVYPEGLP